MRDYTSNVPRLYLLSGLWCMLILLPVIVPYFKSLGLTMKNIYELQAFFGAWVLILEVPSGYFSDLFGRKRTLIIACIFHALGFTVFAWASNFWELLIGEFLLAIGVSLYSGTDTSLIYDSLAASKVTKAPIQILGRKIYYQQLGETLGGLIGGWLVLVSLDAPALTQSVVAWVPLLVVLGLQEPPREKMDKQAHRQNFGLVKKALFGHSKLLTLIILNTMIWGSATLVAVWAFQEQWRELGIPLSYFGYIWAASNFTVAVFARVAHKMERTVGSTTVVLLIAALPLLGYLGMTLEALGAAGVCILFQASRGLIGVVLRDGLNRRVGSELRATANSVVSLGVRGSFLLLGPLMGWCIDHGGVALGAWVMFGFYSLVGGILVVLLLNQRAYFED